MLLPASFLSMIPSKAVRSYPDNNGFVFQCDIFRLIRYAFHLLLKSSSFFILSHGESRAHRQKGRFFLTPGEVCSKEMKLFIFFVQGGSQLLATF